VKGGGVGGMERGRGGGMEVVEGVGSGRCRWAKGSGNGGASGEVREMEGVKGEGVGNGGGEEGGEGN
jgi:hypothetical protein